MMNKKAPVDVSKSEAKIEFVPVKLVQNVSRDVQLTSYGQITPNATLDVAFEVQGELERGNLTIRPGVKFKKGQVLYSVNNTEAFYTLNARKAQLANQVLNILADIELDFPSEKKKWSNFLDKINPENRLPDIPAINSSKERMFLTSRNVLSEYYNLKSMEARLEKYYFTAPFSGTVIEIFAEPGAIVNPGARIATIAKTGDYEVKIPINTSILPTFQKEGITTFTDASGNAVGTGKILRISDVINRNTQSVDVYYSITPVKSTTIYSGMFVNAVISQKAKINSMSIPRAAVNKGQVMVLKDSALVSVPVVEVGRKPDTLFITGLEDGSLVLLEMIDKADKNKKYVGVQR